MLSYKDSSCSQLLCLFLLLICLHTLQQLWHFFLCCWLTRPGRRKKHNECHSQICYINLHLTFPGEVACFTWSSSSMAVSTNISCSSLMLDSRQRISWWRSSISVRAWLEIWLSEVICERENAQAVFELSYKWLQTYKNCLSEWPKKRWKKRC